MAVSDAILKRLLALHPKIIDLRLDRMWRILDALGNPQDKLPPVIQVAGTNGKGSTIAFTRAILEAAGRRVHAYTSPHLVSFHERVRIGKPGGSDLISETDLSDLLEVCEQANDGEPITFFEITTAAALLAFARQPADYVLLEVGLGGRLDATNVVSKPALSVITPIDYDHQQYLGESLGEIATEKAGILKSNVPAVIGPQCDEAFDGIEQVAHIVGAPLAVHGRDWQAFEQHGRLVYQDESGLLDLPLPPLAGHFQIENAGTAVAIVHALGPQPAGEDEIEAGLKSAVWPARLQRLQDGYLSNLAGEGREVWLDGGHNPSAARAIAQSLADLNDRMPRPLILVLGMLNTKPAQDYLRHFAGLASHAVMLAVPDEPNAHSAHCLMQAAQALDINCQSVEGIENAIVAAADHAPDGRIVVCGSLYLAGRALAVHNGEQVSGVSGAGR